MIVTLDVKESGEKKQTVENPGAEKLLDDLGGGQGGIPFYAVIDEKGKKLADANGMPGGKNIGYPATSEEIAAFVKLLKTTAPRLSIADLVRLEKDLKERSPERRAPSGGGS